MNKKSFYKAIHGFNGIELENAPFGFEVIVKWGKFNTDAEARYSSNIGNCDFTANFECDTLNGLSFDEQGFFLNFTSYKGESKILRHPKFEMVVRKNPDLAYITDEDMLDWDISINELHKELIEILFADGKKQIHYGYPFDSLYYGTQIIERNKT